MCVCRVCTRVYTAFTAVNCLLHRFYTVIHRYTPFPHRFHLFHTVYTVYTVNNNKPKPQCLNPGNNINLPLLPRVNGQNRHNTGTEKRCGTVTHRLHRSSHRFSVLSFTPFTPFFTPCRKKARKTTSLRAQLRIVNKLLKARSSLFRDET